MYTGTMVPVPVPVQYDREDDHLLSPLEPQPYGLLNGHYAAATAPLHVELAVAKAASEFDASERYGLACATECVRVAAADPSSWLAFHTKGSAHRSDLGQLGGADPGAEYAIPVARAGSFDSCRVIFAALASAAAYAAPV